MPYGIFPNLDPDLDHDPDKSFSSEIENWTRWTLLKNRLNHHHHYSWSCLHLSQLYSVFSWHSSILLLSILRCRSWLTISIVTWKPFHGWWMDCWRKSTAEVIEAQATLLCNPFESQVLVEVPVHEFDSPVYTFREIALNRTMRNTAQDLVCHHVKVLWFLERLSGRGQDLV